MVTKALSEIIATVLPNVVTESSFFFIVHTNDEDYVGGMRHRAEE